MTLYLNPHSSQYQEGASTATRRAGCTWASVANGIDATTGGRLHPTPDQVNAMLAPMEETSPSTPGWSIPDAVRAARRLGVELVDHTGDGWGAVLLALESGHSIILQGDSDRFDDTSCSGAFDGDHAIHVHPRTKLEDGERWHWVNDPICSTGRWELDDILHAYAAKLHERIRFAAFAAAVPEAAPPPPPAQPVTLRFGARALKRPVAKRIRVPAGRKANVRKAPRTSSRIVARKRRGETFRAWQVTDKGQRLAGSSRWYGNRTGTRWVHASSF